MTLTRRIAKLTARVTADRDPATLSATMVAYIPDNGRGDAPPGAYRVGRDAVLVVYAPGSLPKNGGRS